MKLYGYLCNVFVRIKLFKDKSLINKKVKTMIGMLPEIDNT